MSWSEYGVVLGLIGLILELTGLVDIIPPRVNLLLAGILIFLLALVVFRRIRQWMPSNSEKAGISLIPAECDGINLWNEYTSHARDAKATTKWYKRSWPETYVRVRLHTTPPFESDYYREDLGYPSNGDDREYERAAVAQARRDYVATMMGD